MGTQGTKDQGKCEPPPLCASSSHFFPSLFLPPSEAVTKDVYIMMDGAFFPCVFPSLWSVGCYTSPWE